MAYKGGYLLQPIKTDYGSIGKLYMQGIGAVAQIREGVLKERREMSDNLLKDTSFATTGIHDIDVWTGMGAQMLRDRLQNSFALNDQGFISRNDLNIIKTRTSGEATSIANRAKLFAEQRKEILEDDNAGNLTLEQFDVQWFKDPATVGEVVDENGNVRNANSVYKLEDINGKLFNVITYEYNEINPTTGKKELKTDTIYQPVEETSMSPMKKRWDKVDPNEIAKDFAATIGDKGFSYEGPGGPINISYQQGAQVGDKIEFYKISDPLQFAQAIENHLDSIGDDVYEELAFTNFGVRGNMHSGGASTLTNEQIEQQFGNRFLAKPKIDPNTGEVISFGDKIALSILPNSKGIYDDPSKFITNADGSISMKDTTKELMKGFLREKLYNALNVKTKDVLVAEDEDKKIDTQSLGKGVYYKGGDMANPVGYDKQFWQSRVSLAYLKSNTDVIASDRDIIEREIQQKGYSDVYNKTYMTKGMDLFVNTEGDVFNNVSVNTNLSKLKKAGIGTTSANGNKFDAITGFTTRRINGGRVLIVLTGSSTSSTVKESIGTQAPVNLGGKKDDEPLVKPKDTISRTESIKIGFDFTAPLEQAQAREFYKYLWDNNSQAREHFQKLGKTRDSKSFIMDLHSLAINTK